MLVNLAGRKCLVVGAGIVAAGKIDGLLHCGADVVVVSPRAVLAIQRLAHDGRIVWRQKAFSQRDVQGKFLAIAATNSSKVNEAVFRACAVRGVLCNSADDPEHCDFIYPAVARRGALQIAISTGGCSPALAARLRRELERQFGPEWGAWVEHLGKCRDELLEGKCCRRPADAVCKKWRRQQRFVTFYAIEARRFRGRSVRRNLQRRSPDRPIAWRLPNHACDALLSATPNR